MDVSSGFWQVTVMTLAGCCESADFEEDDTIRDVSLFIRRWAFE